MRRGPAGGVVLWNRSKFALRSQLRDVIACRGIDYDVAQKANTRALDSFQVAHSEFYSGDPQKYSDTFHLDVQVQGSA